MSKDGLLKAQSKGKKLNIMVVGSLFIDKDIDLQLFREVVENDKVFGILRSPKKITNEIRK